MKQTNMTRMKLFAMVILSSAVVLFVACVDLVLAGDTSERSLGAEDKRRVLRALGMTERPESERPSPSTIPNYMLRLYQKQMTKGVSTKGLTVRSHRVHVAQMNSAADGHCALGLAFNVSTVDHLEMDEHIVMATVRLQIPDSKKKWMNVRLVTRDRSMSIEESRPVRKRQSLVFVVTRQLTSCLLKRDCRWTLDSQGSPLCSYANVEGLNPILVVASRLNSSKIGRGTNRRDVRVRPKIPSSSSSNSFRRLGIQERLCQRKQMYVDFREIGWSDWIIAPSGYSAYYCDGACPFPISDQLNTTNHAIIQTLVHSMQPRRATPACCVPTHLAPISMLYFDNHNNVVLRQYEDMVVDACGCR